jgi:hypothetical protein
MAVETRCGSFRLQFLNCSIIQFRSTPMNSDYFSSGDFAGRWSQHRNTYSGAAQLGNQSISTTEMANSANFTVGDAVDSAAGLAVAGGALHQVHRNGGRPITTGFGLPFAFPLENGLGLGFLGVGVHARQFGRSRTFNLSGKDR